MKYDEIWASTPKEIDAYLRGEGAVVGEGGYILGDCRIIVESLPDRKLGSLSVIQTHVVMQGEGVENIHKRFFMNFLKGGA